MTSLASGRTVRASRAGGRSVAPEEGAEGAEVEVQVAQCQAVAAAQVRHRRVEPEQRLPERLDLVVAEVALVDPAQRLPFHQLPDQLDDGEDELEQVALDGA